jgi:hypothetical protein
VAEDEKKKGGGKGKATKTDAHEDIVKKAQEKQGMLSEAGKRDTQSETFAVPKDNAKTSVLTFFAGNSFRYGQRPDYATDNKMTLTANKQMTAIENPEAADRWDVATFWLGPKKYLYVPSDDVDDATIDPEKKKKKAVAQQQSAMNINLYAGTGGGFNPPDPTDKVIAQCDTKMAVTAMIDQVKGEWINIVISGNYYWAKKSHFDWIKDPQSVPKPDDLGGPTVATTTEKEDDAVPDVVATKDEIPLYNNKEDKEPYTALSTKQIDNDMLDFDPMGPGWLSVYVASWGGESYWVKETDYETWKSLNGRKY